MRAALLDLPHDRGMSINQQGGMKMKTLKTLTEWMAIATVFMFALAMLIAVLKA